MQRGSSLRLESEASARVVLALLLAGAAWLRLAGIDYLLPEVMNTDGLAIVRQVECFRAGERGGDWWYSAYPHLLARAVALLPGPDSEPPPFGTLPLAEHLRLASAPWVELRAVSVALSLLLVPGTYLLARRFFARRGSLFAAALVATSLLHVVNAIQEKPHAIAASLVLSSLLASLRLRRRPDLSGHLLAGVAAALAVGVLHNGAVCLAPLAAAWCLRVRGERRGPAALIAIPVALVVAAVLAFYPFFFRPPELHEATAGAVTAGGAATFVQRLTSRFDGAPLGALAEALFGLDPLTWSLAASGAVVLLVRAVRSRGVWRGARRDDLLVVLAFALPYLFVLLAFEGTLVRFFLPVLPVAACVAALGAGALAGRIAHLAADVHLGARIGAALAVLVLAGSAWPAARFALARRAPSPLAEAARWIEEHAARDETIVVIPNHDLPLFATRAALRENAGRHDPPIWTRYQAEIADSSIDGPRFPILVEPGERPASRLLLRDDPAAYLAQHGARFVVLDVSGGGAERIASVATRVARFAPARRDDGRDQGILLWGTGYDRLRPSALGVLRLRNVGTAVEVYRLP